MGSGAGLAGLGRWLLEGGEVRDRIEQSGGKRDSDMEEDGMKRSEGIQRGKSKMRDEKEKVEWGTSRDDISKETLWRVLRSVFRVAISPFLGSSSCIKISPKSINFYPAGFYRQSACKVLRPLLSITEI